MLNVIKKYIYIRVLIHYASSELSSVKYDAIFFLSQLYKYNTLRRFRQTIQTERNFNSLYYTSKFYFQFILMLKQQKASNNYISSLL